MAARRRLLISLLFTDIDEGLDDMSAGNALSTKRRIFWVGLLGVLFFFTLFFFFLACCYFTLLVFTSSFIFDVDAWDGWIWGFGGAGAG